MAEVKLPRLLGAAKEFNVGQDTLVEFLVGKGFNRDDLKPQVKAYRRNVFCLAAKFSGR